MRERDGDRKASNTKWGWAHLLSNFSACFRSALNFGFSFDCSRLMNSCRRTLPFISLTFIRSQFVIFLYFLCFFFFNQKETHIMYDVNVCRFFKKNLETVPMPMPIYHSISKNKKRKNAHCFCLFGVFLLFFCCGLASIRQYPGTVHKYTQYECLARNIYRVAKIHCSDKNLLREQKPHWYLNSTKMHRNPPAHTNTHTHKKKHW